MKISRTAILVLLILGLTAGLSTAGPGTSTAVVSGMVRVASEDEVGNVVAVEILVDDGELEEPYLVAETQKGPELRLYIDQWIIAAGTVVEDENGWKTIEVDHYSLADKYPDPSKVVR